MHQLLRRSITMAATAAMLTAGGLTASAQDDGERALIVPPPEDCVVEPRDQAEIDAILAAGEPAFPLPEGLPVPLGTPADDLTRIEVEDLVYTLLACLNAGDAQRSASLFSENGLHWFYGPIVGSDEGAEQAPAGTPTPRDEGTWLGLRTVTDVSVLDDGRVAAFVVLDDPLVRGPRAQTILLVFTEGDAGLVVDGVVGFSLLIPVGTPTAGTPAP